MPLNLLVMSTTNISNLVTRCVHVGDPDAGYQAIPGHQKQRRDPPHRQRRAVGIAPRLPPAPLLPHEPVLVLRSLKAAHIQYHQGDPKVCTDSTLLWVNVYS